VGRSISERWSELDRRGLEILGDLSVSMPEVEQRLTRELPGHAVIAWQGDPATFQFTYVSSSASAMLGFPVSRWTSEPTFWTDTVVVPGDRDEAVAYCALATAGRCDHVFEYRARAADGRTLILRDLVRVLLGAKGIALQLRGLMFDVTARRHSALSLDELRAAQCPSRAELERLAV
jgi:hypothetical protein